jgi:hypothetical protein
MVAYRKRFIVLRYISNCSVLPFRLVVTTTKAHYGQLGIHGDSNSYSYFELLKQPLATVVKIARAQALQ